MKNLSIQSVDSFKSKYKSVPDNKVLRNMNSDELESYFLMLYNIRNTINQGQAQYNKLLKNNNDKKNRKLETITSDYNERQETLKYYTPETDKIDAKYKQRRDSIVKPINIICKVLSVIIAIIVFLNLFFISKILAAILCFVTYKMVDLILGFVGGFIERRIYKAKYREWTVARALDQDYFNREIARCEAEFESDKQYILSEHKRFDSKIRNDYQSIYTHFENEAQKLETYLPSEFRSLDILSTLFAILNAGFGDSWKEIINVYRDQKNMNELKSHINDIQNTLNSMSNNQKATIQAINHQGQQQQRLLNELNVGIHQSNNNIEKLTNDINRGYEKVQRNQKAIHDELADMNPHNPRSKY